MTIQECYESIGADYAGVLGRFQKQDRIEKFAKMFLGDDSFQLLADSMTNQEYKEAFRAAHTLKGVCQNLGFTRLFEVSSQMTEYLRHEQIPMAEEMLPQVEKEYMATMEAIRQV